MFVTISSINLSILSSRPLSRGSLRFVKNSVSVREHLEKETLLLVLFPPGGLFRPRVVHFLSTRILIERLCYSPVLTVVLPFLRRLSIFCGPQSFGVRDYFKVDTRFPSFYHLKLDIYWKETPSSWSFFFSRVPSYVCWSHLCGTCPGECSPLSGDVCPLVRCWAGSLPSCPLFSDLLLSYIFQSLVPSSLCELRESTGRTKEGSHETKEIIWNGDEIWMKTESQLKKGDSPVPSFNDS